MYLQRVMVNVRLSFAALAGLAFVAGCLQDFEQFRGEGGSGGSPTTTTQTATVTSTVTTGVTCDPANCPGPDTDCTNPVCNGNVCAIGNEPAGAACDDGAAGSKVCDGGGTCVECNGPNDCMAPTPVCLMNLCVAEHCQNMMLDQGLETDIDCGGTECPPCANNLGCQGPTDCQSGFCLNMTCTACADDVDCDEAVQWCNDANNGGTCEAKKPDGQTCGGETECTSDNCIDGFCCGSNGCPDCQSCNIPGSEGTCSNDPGGTGCDDGTFCNGTDMCDGGGTCVHSGNPCPGPDGDNDCSESCNEGADDCSGNDPNNSACNDGTFCNGTDTCNNSGSCANHTGDPCPGPDGDANCAESCNEGADNCTANDPNNSACDDGTFCNGNDTCNNAGSCANHMGDPCTGPLCTDACNEGAGNCTMQQASGSACDADGDMMPGTCNGGGMCSD